MAFKSTNIGLTFCLNMLVLCIKGNLAFADFQFHGQMNSSSFLKKILNDERANKVPEYETVQLEILSKRGIHDQNVMRVHLSAFGRDIDLHLRSDDYFNDRSKNVKIFEARLIENVQLTEIICEGDDPGTTYIDLDQMASVAIRHGPDGKLQMKGAIGDDLLIIPAPTELDALEDNIKYDQDFSDESIDRFNSSGQERSKLFRNFSSATTKSGDHIVYRREMMSKSSFKALDDIRINTNSNAKWRDYKRPVHVWPEILLIVDYDSYTMHASHGFNDTQIKRYYLSLFNAVDLRFKTLSDPKVSLMLTQIWLVKNRDNFPFLMRHMLLNGTVLDGPGALKDLSRVMYAVKTQRTIPINLDFDLAILVTNLNMCDYGLFFCSTATVGLAYFKGACKVFPVEKRWMGVAIVEDKGGFDGIITAAHEIGHLLGSMHDGTTYFGTGATYTSFCRNEDGYIMSIKLTSDRIFQWSECSIQQFKDFLSSENASCLLNQPRYNHLKGSELPGVVLSLDEQCERVWGTRASAMDSRVCVSLLCHKPKNRTFLFTNPDRLLHPAAEGSPCGKDLHCRHGKCVSKYLTYSQAYNMAPDLDRWD